MVEYPYKLLDELELAYAITIHKSQGSEYPAVVIPLLGGPMMLMNRNLLYTAVTRARKCVTLVGYVVTFQQMIRNTSQRTLRPFKRKLNKIIRSCHAGQPVMKIINTGSLVRQLLIYDNRMFAECAFYCYW